MRREVFVVCSVLLVTHLAASITFAQTRLAEAGQDLARQIASVARQGGKKKIAVLPFRGLDGQPNVLGAFVGEELVSQLFVVGGLDLVERSQLDRILTELKLDASGVVDPQTVKQVGRVAGVDAVVTGTVTELESFVAVNCRMVDTETGRVFAAAQTRITKDADLQKLLERAASSATPASETLIEPRSSGRYSGHGFEMEVTSCALRGGLVTCVLTITSVLGDREFGIGTDDSKAYDDRGGEHAIIYGGVTIANRRSDSVDLTTRLVGGLKTSATVTFGGVFSSTQRLTVIELSCWTWGDAADRFKATFRDVSVKR